MIRIEQLKLPIQYTKELLEESLCKELSIQREELLLYEILRRSLDARKKTQIHYSFLIEASILKEKQKWNSYLKKKKGLSLVEKAEYCLPQKRYSQKERPVIVGAGPAGLFCALFLARCGYQPILIERGDCIENRTTCVERFWKDGTLDVESNVQFGEGGAGTFSDGKLNTMVKDTKGRIREVLKTFVSFGAPKEILYLNKPHIGTDYLRVVISNLRKEIEALGGTVFFRSKLTNIHIKTHPDTLKKFVSSIEINNETRLPCNTLVLAIGHSARDTFAMLHALSLSMEPKDFAVGIRVEHPQEYIDKNQYRHLLDSYPSMEHFFEDTKLPHADYKLSYSTKKGRGVYSFCMCPGGFVVNASSELGKLAVNGMSNHDRAEKNANSAIVVTVKKEDFLLQEMIPFDPLIGMHFQRRLEELAYMAGKGKIPIQRYEDFCKNQTTNKLGILKPNTKGAYSLSNLRSFLPSFLTEAILEAMPEFSKRIEGFDDKDVLLEGLESRTSSPVRMNRNEQLQSNIEGIYPCGEGAGYAGGIVSAAVDGIKVFEAIVKAGSIV